MGMTAALVRASEADVRRLRDNPGELPAFLDGGEWVPPVRQVRSKGLLGWLLRLTPVTIEEVDPDAVPPGDMVVGAERPQLDLDKAWQPLHYLLTGTAWDGDEPACYLVRGGEELCEDDESGYSSIRVLTPDQVRRFDQYLNGLSHDTLRQRFDHHAMVALGIYSRSRARKHIHADDEVEHLLEAFDGLRAFVTETVSTGDAAIVYLT
jgi:hypothetical protein